MNIDLIIDMETWTADWDGGGRDTQGVRSGPHQNLIGFDKQRRKFLQLFTSHSTRVSTSPPQLVVQVFMSMDLVLSEQR